ncbi:precorrin-2 dehydrogenase/sirohydrochlorin ferrochelatase family protein [Desulfoluna spongiiphila]|uniref:precorrin-2 dehydrogenase n=1 Tax=Desulfoluna spongiiphila TaxID=419481 RepID=A0A1G5JE32_9BACT|nr:bifunctional precorrin-2 dehydrogenase/sirohydrochlorin ferrochelatase [Desulfoluna spongiiphila]SCY86595.1 precorrin-2 dehydrogenase [Desulfoluna spongiiphila]
MRYYPVSLDIMGKACLVVGGGAVGTRKVETLVRCGAHVTVVSKAFTDELKAMAQDAPITLEERAYDASDMDGKFLVIVATDDQAFNTRVSRDAEATCKLCNVADYPSACNFILPSIVQRGDMTLSISTSGKSPAFAKWMRRRLETEFGDEYGEFLELMGLVRKKLLAEAHEPEAHKPLFEALIAGGLLEMVKAGDKKGADAFLTEVLGEGYTCDTLGFSL